MEEKFLTVCETPVRYIECNTVITGSGAAAFAAANRLLDLGQKDIVLLTEGLNMGTSRNTGSDKQTYYKLTLSGGSPDSVEQMARTLFEGESMDGDLALCEAAGSVRCFFYLCEAGVPFPHNEAGEYIGYKTDHDPAMRATSAGPLTSRFMTECLQRRAAERGLKILDGVLAVSLLRAGDDGPCCGLLGYGADGSWTLVNATNVIWATGGPAGVYAASVYPASQTGGTGVALKAGAVAKNLTEWQYGITSVKFRWNVSGSYQQVLPRYVSTAADGSDPREFLADAFGNTEQMLEAQFLKGYQWPFDPRKIENGGSSLLDVLVYREITEKGRRVWLDYMHDPAGLVAEGEQAFRMLRPVPYSYLENCGCLLKTPIERLKKMNPKAIELYRSHGIDLASEMLEIAVCAQHNNGGLAADLWWESNIPHLFPIGEANGSHGVYRPGGAALNSGQVGALRAAQRIRYRYREQPMDREEFLKIAGETLRQETEFVNALKSRNGCRPREIRDSMAALMTRCCAHMRSLDKAVLAEKELAALGMRLEREASADTPAETAEAFRTRDLLLTARALAASIETYIKDGGGSRGSYLIEGTAPDQGAHADRILETVCRDGAPECGFRQVRPIPERDLWFETAWEKFNEMTGA